MLDGLGTLADTEPNVNFVDNVDDLAREVIDDLYVRRFYRDHDGLVDVAPGRPSVWRASRSTTRCAEIYPRAPRDRSPEAMRCRLALAVRDELEAASARWG